MPSRFHPKADVSYFFFKEFAIFQILGCRNMEFDAIIAISANCCYFNSVFIFMFASMQTEVAIPIVSFFSDKINGTIYQISR